MGRRAHVDVHQCRGGVGLGDIAAARAAFDKALAIDPRLELDRALATAQVTHAFAEARRAAQASH